MKSFPQGMVDDPARLDPEGGWSCDIQPQPQYSAWPGAGPGLSQEAGSQAGDAGEASLKEMREAMEFHPRHMDPQHFTLYTMLQQRYPKMLTVFAIYFYPQFRHRKTRPERLNAFVNKVFPVAEQEKITQVKSSSC